MGVHLSRTLPKESLYEENRILLEDAIQRVRNNDSETLNLDLSNRGIGERGMELGAPSLRHNSTLIHLNVSCNFIGDTGVKALVNALLASPCPLRLLNLSGNNIRGSGCESLAQLLEWEGCKLTDLILFNNEICDQDALPIINALTTNASLSNLNLNLNVISHRGVHALIEMCKMNTRVQKLSVDCQRWLQDAKRNSLMPKAHRKVHTPDLQRFVEAVHELNNVLRLNSAAKLSDETMAEMPTTDGRECSIESAHIIDHPCPVHEDFDVESKNSLTENILDEDEQPNFDRHLEDPICEGDASYSGTLHPTTHTNDFKKNSTYKKTTKSSHSFSSEYFERIHQHTILWKKQLEKARAKDLRQGFTQYVRDDSGNWVPKPDTERKLIACFCEPHDITAPYARQLHYHCRYEIDFRDSRNVDALSKKYEGCHGRAHRCASVGDKVKPKRNVSPMTFFASEHPAAAQN